MKEAYGSMLLWIIVIFFLAVFSSYLALSVNYSRAFKVKNEIVNIIERNKGLSTRSGSSTNAIQEIQEYLADVGYRTKGTCGKKTRDYNEEYAASGGWTGYSLNGGETTNNAVFCIHAVTTGVTRRSNASQTYEFPYSKYYTVQVFFKLDIPIFDQIFKSSIYGSTKTLVLPSDRG